MKILALDPARKTGYAVLDDGALVTSGVLQLGPVGVPHGQALAALCDFVARMLTAHEPAAIVWEAPTPSQHRRSELQELAPAVLLLMAARRNLQTQCFYPATIKKTVAGNGRADKHDVIAAVRRKFRQLPTKLDDNEADAIAVGLTCNERTTTK